MKRVIIYASVSTKEQNVDMQLTDMREYAKSSFCEIAYFFLKKISQFRL
jgi:DNA invertase Pin-like site-specific DNA recombinase